MIPDIYVCETEPKHASSCTRQKNPNAPKKCFFCGENVTKISVESLLNDSRFLDALEAAGVDNWEGYSEAYTILRERGHER